uniref:Contactin associated protein 2 n=1 Tax=Callithrix jacchus TaxID=9483 RepID=A0A8I3ZYS0_CALJA
MLFQRFIKDMPDSRIILTNTYTEIFIESLSLCLLFLEKCDEPLVSGLPHVSFSSSSSMSGSYSPGYAKINKRGGAGGWSPSDSDHYQWLQVDFGNRKQISAIATQGRYSSSDWVTQYRMLYSDTGRNWKPYHQDGNIWMPLAQSPRAMDHKILMYLLLGFMLDASDQTQRFISNITDDRVKCRMLLHTSKAKKRQLYFCIWINSN